MSSFSPGRSRLILAAAAFIAMVALTVLASEPNEGRSGGIDGDAARNGCTCHSSSADSGVTPQLQGLPHRYEAGETYTLELSFSGGPAAGGSNKGGFNLKASAGSLAKVAGDNKVQAKSDGTLTHTGAGNDQRNWTVEWTAPASVTENVTFRLFVNSVNGNGGNDNGDRWNRLDLTAMGNYRDAAVGDLRLPSKVLADTPVSFSALLVNKGYSNLTDTGLKATVSREGSPVWNDTRPVAQLAEGQKTRLTFDWPGGAAGNYSVKVETLTGDDNAANDETTGSLEVSPRLTDAGLADIALEPIGYEFEPYPFSAKLTNNGNANLTNLSVRAVVESGGLEFWSENRTVALLNEGENQSLDWSWPGGRAGNYTLKLTLAGDDDAPSNDLLTTSFSLRGNLSLLKLAGFEAPANLTAGGVLSVKAIINNPGSVNVSQARFVLELAADGVVQWRDKRLEGPVAPATPLIISWTRDGPVVGNYTLRLRAVDPLDFTAPRLLAEADLEIEPKPKPPKNETADPSDETPPPTEEPEEDEDSPAPGMGAGAVATLLAGLGLRGARGRKR